MKCTYLHLPTYGLCSFAKEQSVSKYNSRQITLFSSLYSSIFLYLSLSRYLYIALSLSLSLPLPLSTSISISGPIWFYLYLLLSLKSFSLSLSFSLCLSFSSFQVLKFWAPSTFCSATRKTSLVQVNLWMPDWHMRMPCLWMGSTMEAEECERELLCRARPTPLPPCARTLQMSLKCARERERVWCVF